MSGAMTPEPHDSPLMVAWNAYKATAEYANTLRWAMHREHAEGSLWAAFSAGFRPDHTTAPTPRETRAEIVAWCPRDKNGAYYVEHAEIVREGVEDDVRILNQMQPDFAPYTVATLYAHPAPASASVTEAEKMLWVIVFEDDDVEDVHYVGTQAEAQAAKRKYEERFACHLYVHETFLTAALTALAAAPVPSASVTEAAAALLAKLDHIFESPEYVGVFSLAQLHGGPYRGPQCADEMAALRTALAAAPRDAGSSDAGTQIAAFCDGAEWANGKPFPSPEHVKHEAVRRYALAAAPVPSASVTEAVAISERGEPYPTDVESLMRIEWDAKELRKVGGMRHDVARLFAHYTVNEASEPVSAELLNLARAYLFALAAAPGTGASVVDIAPSADLPKLGQPAEAPGWRGDAAVAAFRERLELRIREAVDQVARMAGHTSGASLNLKGFDRFLDCLCDAAAGAALAAAPRDAGREEDRSDAERWRAIRSRLRIVGGESHPFVEFLEPSGFIDEDDFVDDNGVAITPEPTFEQLLDRYRAARRGGAA